MSDKFSLESIQESVLCLLQHFQRNALWEKGITEKLKLSFWGREDLLDVLNLRKEKWDFQKEPVFEFPMLSFLPLLWSCGYYIKAENKNSVKIGDSVVALELAPLQNITDEGGDLTLEGNILHNSSPNGYVYVYVYKFVDVPKKEISIDKLWEDFQELPPEGEWKALGQYIQATWARFEFIDAIDNPKMVIDYIKPILDKNFKPSIVKP